MPHTGWPPTTLMACPHVPGLLDVSPGTTQVPCAHHARYALSALDDEGLLKGLGRKMADFPMELPPAKMLFLPTVVKKSAFRLGTV